jgi:hypothetical protein
MGVFPLDEYRVFLDSVIEVPKTTEAEIRRRLNNALFPDKFIFKFINISIQTLKNVRLV